MSTVERFEDLEVWQEARSIVRDIYRLTASGDWSRDFGMRDQIRRAAVSTMSNIAEGFERGTDREFARFLQIAKASAGEVRSLFIVAGDVGYVTQEQVAEPIRRIEMVSRKISRLIAYLRKPERGVREQKRK